MGSSRKIIFATLVHEYGFHTVVFGEVILHGPFSKSKPVVELQPGPPLSHIMRGADPGSFRASKNLRVPRLLSDKAERRSIAMTPTRRRGDGCPKYQGSLSIA